MANRIKYRLLTRSDLDGLVCAVLMKYIDMVDEIKLIDHPSAMQEKSVEVSETDITTNLPYVPGVHLAIDHHVSESMRNKKNEHHIIDPNAPSAARVVYNYFGGKNRFPDFFDDMMTGVDQADSGQFTKAEILNPTGWALLNFLVDQRTGIEEFGNYGVSEKKFKLNLIAYCDHMKIDEILGLPEVRERSAVYFEYEDKYKQQLQSAATIHNNIVVLDFRQQAIQYPVKYPVKYPGNRFIVYALFPQCNISILIRTDPENNKTIFSVGKSIINRSSNVNIGEIMLSYGGGGHRAAGACHMDSKDADDAFKELLSLLMG
jgi:oligoribonuclease NrnB/cAMP/cGMP phosphodiesterase (DHH superfamily)